MVNVVSNEAMSYKIAQIEMVLDDHIWISAKVVDREFWQK